MNGIALLFKFMTRLPIGFEPKFDSDSLGKSMKFFPIVGMVMGLILLAFFWALSYVIYSPMVMVVTLVIIEVILTGGLHLDGLADTFDGIFSYRSKQKMLDIMKDSRLGTNGGLVLILYFILKVALIYELDMIAGIPSGIVLLLTPAIARLNSVINCASAPYARATGVTNTTRLRNSSNTIGLKPSQSQIINCNSQLRRCFFINNRSSFCNSRNPLYHSWRKSCTKRLYLELIFAISFEGIIYRK